MLGSVAIIFLLGFAAAHICEKFVIPRIIGMLMVGIALGPHMANVLDSSILLISSELRQMAFVIILLKAGFSLQVEDMRKIGKPAFLLSFIPASCEILAFMCMGPIFLELTLLQSALMGALVAAVSPAVVVPTMVKLMEKGYGVNKKIPQMLLTGASCDGVYVVVFFSALLSLTQGEGDGLGIFIRIFESIVLGIGTGVLVAYILYKIFIYMGTACSSMYKTIFVLCVAFLLLSLEAILAKWIIFSGILAIMTMGIAMRYLVVQKSWQEGEYIQHISHNLSKLWQVAEVLLFVLVGAAVNVNATMELGFIAIFMLIISLFFRSVGVFMCLWGTLLTMKERVFCVMAYWPKATIQAALGSLPLAMGLAGGQSMLSMAVLAIICTVPLGMIIDKYYAQLLEKNNE